jgi:hypothetical protein
VGIPPGREFEGYDHFGDPDHYKGFIYVPFEMNSRKKVPRVLVFEAKTLKFKGHEKLVDQGEKDAPWCAINPRNGLLYSSGFNSGAFSPNGHLDLVSDAGREKGGIMGFDMITGQRIMHKPVNYGGIGTARQALEGVTILDLDSVSAPKIDGQIHLIMLDNDVGNDEIYFKHYRVKKEDREKV